MTYQELVEGPCLDLYKSYASEGNAFLGMHQARVYLCQHLVECSDYADHIEKIKKLDEWKEMETATRAAIENIKTIFK